MKSLLALVTLALAALVVEEKARQLAGEAVVQARDAKKTLSQQVEQQPLLSLLIAGGAAYALASLIPKNR